MKINRTHILLLTGLLLLAITACNFSASTAKIKEAYTAREVDGKQEATTTFNQDEVFFLVVNVANAPDDTITKAVWYAVNAEGVEPNMVLKEFEYTGGGEITFDLSNTNLWPVGTYKVELFLDDKLAQTLDFNVAGSAASSAGSGGVSVLDAFTARFVGETPEKTIVFGADEEFFAVMELSGVQPDTVVKAVWVAVNAEGVDANSIITETEIRGESRITFNLSYPEPWPVGAYKVEFYLNGEYQGFLDFTVE